jgi:hypothetical protein
MVYGGSKPTGSQGATQRREEEGVFKGGKRKYKFSSTLTLRAGDDRQKHQLCMTTQKTSLLVSPFSLFI